jgi:hypothetical protein
MPHPKDLDPNKTTGEKLAIVAGQLEDVVTEAIESAEKRGERRGREDERHNTGNTPPVSSISSDALQVAVEKRCADCRKPGGSIFELWEEFKPIRLRVWLMTATAAVIVAVFGYTMPRINSKLDAIDAMAKDVSALKVQVEFLIARPGSRTEISAEESASYAALPSNDGAKP